MSTLIDVHALKAIEELQRPGKPDLLSRVTELFRTESPKCIQQVEEGLETVDMPGIRDAAHTLKSSSAYLGAKSLSERCRDLETAAREENFPGCVALGNDLRDLFENSLEELDRHVARKVA